MNTPVLTEAGEYRREVAASLLRIFENVFDWEHLAGLHGESFDAVRLIELDREGWRVGLTPVSGRSPGEERIVKLRADKPARRYVVQTQSGPGAGTEVHTELSVLGPERTGVRVAFHLPLPAGEAASRLGQAYARSYAQLWDEDERMMQRRERLDGLALVAPLGALDLGPVEGVRRRAPFTQPWGELPVRVAEVEGALVAYAAVCPHWLGPLDETPVEAGCVRCPWHGYRFDVRTGESVDGRGLRLAPLLDLAVEDGRAVVRSRDAGRG